LPFSVDTLQATGKPFPIAQRGSSPQVSRSGTLVYSDVPSRRLQLAWYDRAGKMLSTIGEPVAQNSPALSPDGRRLAVEDLEKDPDLWIYDVTRGIKTRLTVDKAPEAFPVWTPSGDEVTYASLRNGLSAIFSRSSNGSGEERLLAGPPLDERAPDWSSDGRFLIYSAGSNDIKSHLLYRERRPDGSLGDPAVFLKTRFNERQPRFSPDGRWVAYVSDQSGANEVYVRQFPAGAGQWQISSKGGNGPRWRRDGRELFYLDQTRLMAVAVSTRPAFTPAAPVLLFQHLLLQTGYDVSADGQRFVALGRSAGEPPLAIHVVHNWFEEFRGQQH
jgi:Tol biopolymer transport system component